MGDFKRKKIKKKIKKKLFIFVNIIIEIEYLDKI
jgi:hypothetical protein